MKENNYNEEQLFNPGKDSIIYKKWDYSGENYNTAEEGILHVDCKVPYISFKSLDKLSYIKSGFSTRLGGVSSGFLGTLNLSFSRGDDDEAVFENYKRFSDSLGLSSDYFVFSDQVHDTNIYKVEEIDRGKGIKYESDIKEIDGLITNVTNITLVTFYADCVPLYFIDTKNKAIGLSHSGWRGTVDKIGKKTVDAMKREFGTEGSDIISVIGPSICHECYEVSKDVTEKFEKAFSKEICDRIIYKNKNGRYQLDLWLANKYILLEAGISKENIHISEICTCCNSSLLYSHRASNGNRGNLVAVLSLNL